MPLLHHQPLKSLYLTTSYIQLLTLRLPYWFLRYLLFKKTRPRASWTIWRCLCVRYVKWRGGVETTVGGMGYMPSYKKLETDTNKGIDGVWIDPAPELIHGEIKKWASEAGVSSVRLPGYWHTTPNTPRLPVGAPPTSPTEKVLLFFHGGGYTALSAHPSIPVNTNISTILSQTTSATRALGLEYRLASPSSPGSTFPAQIVDAIAGYKYLVSVVGFKPQNIVLVGDSAGGNLCLALSRYCVEYSGEVEGLPKPPGGMVLLSPWADLTASHAKSVETSSAYTNLESDFIGHPTPDDPISGSAGVYCGGLDHSILTHPYVSPACLTPSSGISFKNHPKSFVLYGDAEVLMDSIITLIGLMKRDMGSDSVVVYAAKDVYHDPLPFTFFEPERTDIACAAGRFIDGLL